MSTAIAAADVVLWRHLERSGQRVAQLGEGWIG